MVKKFVEVRMLTNTAYQGPRKEGDVIRVPEDFAERWVKNGIAEYTSEAEQEGADTDAEPENTEPENTEDEQVDEETVDYESMNAKELYALCKEKGIEVEAKKSKEYYIEKLA